MSGFSKIILILVFPVILYSFYFLSVDTVIGLATIPSPVVITSPTPTPKIEVPILPPTTPKASSCVGAGCSPPPGGAGKQCSTNGNSGIETAIGCIPTEPTKLITAISQLATGAGGGIALLLMIAGVFRMMTSAGNPDAVKAGSEQFTSALIGLLFIIFAVLLLKVIGVDILNIPGFGQ